MTEDSETPEEQTGSREEPAHPEQADRPPGGEVQQPQLLTSQATGDGDIVVADEPEETDGINPLPYLVAGIGASAGGVEAYIELFRNLSPETGIAFVIIPHLLATQKSHLVEILGRATSMPVEEITDRMRPEPDRVYILPPNTRVRLDQGTLRLDTRSTERVPRPIDFFFRSLGSHQKTRSVGIVLSGTDADGALGLKAIKGEGGIAIVQSPESARFSEMPLSSISIDHVDRILPPGQIGVELANLAKRFHEPMLRTLESGKPQPADEQQFFRILTLMRGVSGIDFRLYKPTTIRRRIARRMLLHPIHTMGDYANMLQGNPQELRELVEDALIDVTRFFRDPAVFEALKHVILPRIFEGREADQQIRIWVPGCSSGEEVYSIAMVVLEYLTGQSLEPPIQIFGTDASESNIQKARTGVYPESIVGEVSVERLRRFFVKIDKGYQVGKRVRDLCIFARQNLCHDPPFSKMDFISCRNVLIYMGTELQKQVLPTFHYALRPNGFLLLGTSETIRDFTDLFQLIDRKNKFFAKVGNNPSRMMMAIAPRLFLPDTTPPILPPTTENWSELELQRAADRIVLARYGPPGVIVDERLDLVQSRGHTAPFLEMPHGSVSLQLTRMLRDGIAAPIIQAVRRAIEQDIPVHVNGLVVRSEDQEYEIAVEVMPIHTMAPRARCFLVLFVPSRERTVTVTSPRKLPEGEAPAAEVDVVTRLRQDLASTKLYLQTLLEERDAKNQELLSANEEIQSANEEMQSTNEELETTKEELQSSNEELQTVNDELQQRNASLTQSTNDLSNLLNSVNLPVLMLSNELTIRHFTPPTQRLMNLRTPDIGRPFSDIRVNLNVGDLEPLFSEVLDTLTSHEVEVQDREGHWYLLRVRPYRTTDNKIDGVVIVLLDIDQLRRSQQELRTARDFARSVIENVPFPLAVVDPELRMRFFNDAFRVIAGLPKEDLEHRSLPDIASMAWGLQEPLTTRLDELRKSKNDGRNFEFQFRTPGDKPRTFNVTGRVLKPDSETFLLVTVEDLTPHMQVEDKLSIERERLANQVESAAEELGRTQHELRSLAGSLFTSQEDERRRVARELHDDISQKLAVLEIDTQQIEDQLSRPSGDSSGIARELDRVRNAIGSLSEDVRRLSHALHPSVLDDLGLASGIRSLVDDFRERENMIVTFTAHKVPEKLLGPTAIGLYRITQEALRNVAKHAGRTHVKVVLRSDGSALHLQIIDSGEGFDTEQRRSGLGLISMEERARMLGGTFRIESELGEGTKINVDVPLAADSEPQP